MIHNYDTGPADFPYADYGSLNYWNNLFDTQTDDVSLIMTPEAATWLVHTASDVCDESLQPLVDCIGDQLPKSRHAWSGLRRSAVRALCDQVFPDTAELADVIELDQPEPRGRLVS